MTGCRVNDRYSACGLEIGDHTLDPRTRSWIHPELSARGYWVTPPLECVADSNVLHDIDAIHLCTDCMPNTTEDA